MDHYRGGRDSVARIAQSVWRTAGHVAVLLAVTACSALPLPGRSAQPTSPVPLDLPSATQARLRDFDLAVKDLRERHIDPRIVDDAWLAEAAAFRRSIIDGIENDAYLAGFQRLLAKLGDPAIALRPLPSNDGPASASFTGIGVVVGAPQAGKDRLVVLTVYAGSPAEKAGIRAHDVILAVDGEPVNSDDWQTTIGRIRGPAGTTVTLTVRSPGEVAREVVARRGPITPNRQSLIERVPGTNIGYLAPGQGSAEDLPIELARGLRDLASDKTPDGIILDLRTVQEPSFPIISMLSLFANGAAGTRHSRSGQQRIEVRGRQIDGSQDLPLVILIGDQTQGPAISFAAMLQDLGRARLVGAKTSPAVAEPVILNLRETGLQLAIPAVEYRGVKGRALHRAGLAPDEDTGLSWEEITSDNDVQLERAIALLKR